jgi:scyllo-inositol 2-dehydrogenase (NADP+)
MHIGYFIFSSLVVNYDDLLMNTIKTALCSFGMSGKLFHAPFLHLHPAFELYAVLERTKQLAAEIYPAIKKYRSFEKLISDEAIGLIIINTPNVTHFDFAKQALLAGKHVVVEKPFTPELNEAEELIQLAASKKKVLSVFHNRRYDSDFKTVRKIIEGGSLGEIVEAEVHFDRYKPALSPKIHKETPGPATGALYDLGSHLIDQALVLFGMPEAVFADIQIIRPASLVDDYFEVLLYYTNKRVRLKGSYITREPIPSYIIHGMNGSFLKSRSDIQEASLLAEHLPSEKDWGVEPSSEKGLLHTEIDSEVIRKSIESETGDYMDYYHQIQLAINEGKAVPVSGEDGLNVIKIIKAAFQSNDEKRVIEL